MQSGANAAELFDRVLKPLVLGGTIRPLEPIGAKKAVQIAEQAVQSMSAVDVSWVNAARIRNVRYLCPLDVLPSLSRFEWLMIMALNDLICSTDPEIESFLSSDRSAQAVHGALEILALVPAAKTVGEALARHATFHALTRVCRTDTTVSWWCGSRCFVGRTPPNRFLSWPRVRRVHTKREELTLGCMAAGSESAKADYLEGIKALLARTPLTDLATAARTIPVFAWSSPTLSMLCGTSGRTVALRALCLDANPATVSALRRAGESIVPSPTAGIRTCLESVLQELDAKINS